MAKANAPVNKTLVLLDRTIGPRQCASFKGSLLFFSFLFFFTYVPKPFRINGGRNGGLSFLYAFVPRQQPVRMDTLMA
jgi:hypothetical protein